MPNSFDVHNAELHRDWSNDIDFGKPLVIPIFVSRSKHYKLMIVSHNPSHYCLLDPLGLNHSTNPYSDKAKQAVLGWLQIRLPCVVYSELPATLEQFPVQADGVSCGVYIFYYAFHILRNFQHFTPIGFERLSSDFEFGSHVLHLMRLYMLRLLIPAQQLDQVGSLGSPDKSTGKRKSPLDSSRLQPAAQQLVASSGGDERGIFQMLGSLGSPPKSFGQLNTQFDPNLTSVNLPKRKRHRPLFNSISVRDKEVFQIYNNSENLPGFFSD
jgi:hypothetical protein